MYNRVSTLFSQMSTNRHGHGFGLQVCKGGVSKTISFCCIMQHIVIIIRNYVYI